ncbi:MAG TPA: hypothetical protein VH477_00290 [Bryobacteraceae bacterium]|jgi:hypothetical protein
MPAFATEAYDDETYEAFDDESSDDEAFDDESSDDEASPRRLRFRPRRRLSLIGGTAANVPSVDRLVVNTPRGPITLNLQEKLVREEGLKTASARLEKAINQHSTRLNATQNDLGTLSKRVSTEVAGIHKSIKRVKKSQQDSMMLSLMLPMLLGGGGANNNLLLILPFMMMGMGGSGGSDMTAMMPLFLIAAMNQPQP